MVLVLLVSLLLLPATSAGRDLSGRIDTYLRAYEARGDFSGCVLVTRGPDSLFEGTYGRASFELDVPHTMQSKFQIGSVSKQFTAASILLLRDRGRLQLEATLDRWIPAMPRSDEITLHQLLTHTSGVRNLFAVPRYAEVKTHDLSTEQLVDLLLDQPLDFEPGSQHSYSNSGYILLARVLEIESGASFADFLATEVTGPLGLHDTRDLSWGPVTAGLVTGYDPDGATGVRHPDFVHPSTTRGAGSLVSSAADLVTWNRRLGQLLSAESLELMRTAHNGTYGYGVACYEVDGRRIIAHDGRVPGFTTDVSYYPDDDVCVVVLSNVQSGIGDAFRRDLRKMVFDGEAIVPEPRPLHEGLVVVDALADLEGRYAFGPSLLVTAEVREKVLWLAANGGEWSQLVPESSERFFNRMLYASVGFEHDEAQQVSAMLWIQDGNQFAGPRQGD